jgi:hypothetical protein
MANDTVDGTPQGESSETPETVPEHAQEPAWASEEVDVPGLNRRMKLGDVVKMAHESHRTATESKREAFEANQARVQLEESYRPFSERYHGDQQFRSLVDEGYNAGQYGAQPQAAIPAIDNRQTNEIVARLDAADDQRDFDRIRKEFPLSDDMELSVLEEKNRTGESVESVYWRMFGSQLVADAKKTTRAETADDMTKNRDIYSAPTKSSTQRPAAPDVSKMSEDEHREGGLKRLRGMGFV